MGRFNLPFFISIPHSGEKIPESCDWLKTLPEEILMCDVDRFVDQLYSPVIRELEISNTTTEWHRYAADLNRLPGDIDCTSVLGNKNSAGTHARGFHWVITTLKYQLMKTPMTQELHSELVKLIYEPFHKSIQNHYDSIFAKGFSQVYHLDCHSMPSVGTAEHRDPGETRAEIVVSDCRGQSSNANFVDLVMTAFARAGFKVAYNWPYFGGRVSEQYGQPKLGKNAVQVELSRGLYMNEKTKKLLDSHVKVQGQLSVAINHLLKSLPLLMKG